MARFGIKNCNMVCNFIVTGSKLVKDENGKVVDASNYKQIVGCLTYLLATRPDLAYSVCFVARYMERPTEMHLSAIKRIFRYLKGIVNFGVMYKKEERVTLISWSDSDYVGDTYDRKSTSGYVFILEMEQYHSHLISNLLLLFLLLKLSMLQQLHALVKEFG